MSFDPAAVAARYNLAHATVDPADWYACIADIPTLLLHVAEQAAKLDAVAALVATPVPAYIEVADIRAALTKEPTA